MKFDTQLMNKLLSILIALFLQQIYFYVEKLSLLVIWYSVVDFFNCNILLQAFAFC